ncbi:MFS transporter [Schaalia sp. ZJ405]|uniref:MFS transporter n=1 Tax=unclassified Schaalia TaxID=2691889 RepID=UPI0013EB43E6|nr:MULTISPECIES: MFS transporter [unclassified Schaalia]QPK81458.1 MFS transporter [Schaalia sp. ZJ405]
MSADTPKSQLSPKAAHLYRRLTMATAFGQGLDGYDLGVLSVVMISLTHDLGLSPLETGLIGASSLIGIFLGGPIFGYLTDRFGRRLMFHIDIIIFIVAGFGQALVPDGILLFVARLALGIAIGAEYAIGAPMLAEFSPAHHRGKRLSSLQICWYGGFLAAVIIAHLLDTAGLHWRWILATCGIPAIITYILRHHLPESPRWLMSKGYEDEARALIEQYNLDPSDTSGEAETRTSLRSLFVGAQAKRTIFVCVFWACLVAPYFAIFTFAPTVLGAAGLGEGNGATILTNTVALLGVTVGTFIVDRMGRRPMLIGPFWIQAIALGLVAVVAHPPLILLSACFWAFAFFNSLSACLTAVYPAELFPTALRTSGVGLGTAASRIGAAIGTWLLPVGIETIGIRACMLIGALMCVAGALISQFMAPETNGQNLHAITS